MLARSGALASALALLICLAPARDARAEFCRSTTCKQSVECSSDGIPNPACKPLFWAKPCIGFSVHQDGAPGFVDYATASRFTQRAFDTWTRAECGAASPNLRIVDLGPVACNVLEYNRTAPNANVIMFREWGNEHENSSLLGLTTATYDAETGEIFDADMEINLAQNLTTSEKNPGFDFLSVLTHEAGHFLGLGHTPFDSSPGGENGADIPTMTDSYNGGNLYLRTLRPGDEDGICSVYPPQGSPPPESCNAIPRHGFSPECAENQTEGDCAVAAPGRESRAGLAALALAALALGLRVRAGSGSRRR